MLPVNELVKFAAEQYTKIASTLPPSGDYPSLGVPTNPTWKTSKKEWTVGFYPGSLWLIFEHTGDAKWRQLAEASQEGVKAFENNTQTHDVGFVIMSTYGNGYRLVHNKSYERVIKNAAKSLATRFKPKVGCFRSWNNRPGDGGTPDEFKVIVDNMMNLELMYTASILTGDSKYREMADSHARRTLKEHFRSDGSSYHVVAYSQTTGKVLRKYTWQGYADSSCWGRGQAWALAGYTISYRFTKDPAFLQVATKVADYFIDHLPDDGVPYWDFNAPLDAGYVPRDTSAAAVAASGLLELFNHTNEKRYFEAGEKMLISLASSKYRADGRPEYRIPAILVNGTIFYKQGIFDTATPYGDYYFLHALGLYRRLKGSE
ncbi:uncharacterized protein VTP21DRAFT_5030 [Calcarisporiella thermophila]|uniref:uncharacterized protein n=1 Tax=Calcarisporiella thermophila TaxID=911321 RepID=UPI003741F931